MKYNWHLGRFGLVGIILFAGNYGLFWILFLTLQAQLEIWEIGILQWIISVSLSHHAYRRLVFSDSMRPYLQSLLRYSLSTIILAALSISILTYLYEVLDFPILMAQGLTVGSTMAIGYLLAAKFTFDSWDSANSTQ